MKRHALNAQKRTVIGKKVRFLRRDGFLPIGVYGQGMTSLSLQTKLIDFKKVYHEAGETGLVDVKVGDETYTCLIKNVQKHPVTNNVIHAEIHKVNLKEKITVKVPLEIVGESPAVVDQIGLLLQTLQEIEVQALPTDLPEKVELNVTNLKAIADQMIVSDLGKLPNVEILTPSEEVIVKIVPAVSEEVKKEAEAAAATAAAQASTATEEQVQAGEGEQVKAEDGAPESTTENKSTEGKK